MIWNQNVCSLYQAVCDDGVEVQGDGDGNVAQVFADWLTALLKEKLRVAG